MSCTAQFNIDISEVGPNVEAVARHLTKIVTGEFQIRVPRQPYPAALAVERPENSRGKLEPRRADGCCAEGMARRVLWGASLLSSPGPSVPSAGPGRTQKVSPQTIHKRAYHAIIPTGLKYESAAHP